MFLKLINLGQHFIFVKIRKLSMIFFIFVLLLSSCATQFPKIDIPNTEPPAKKIDHLHPRVVLVLGSGSARGFSHAGVLKVLEDNHIPIDLIVGTSAGSIVGSLYADNPSADSLQNILLTAKRNEVIDFSLLNIPSGAVSGAGLQYFLIKNLHAASFDQLKIPFVAVAVDLQSGKIHVFKSGPIAPAVNASSAAPPFFRPVKIYGRTYVDGGLIDPVAVDVAKQFHPKIIIAVMLDYPLPNSLPSSSPRVFLRGFDMMLLKLNESSARGADIIIRPDVGYIDMFEENGRAKLMHAGEVAAKKALPNIRKLLEKKKVSI